MNRLVIVPDDSLELLVGSLKSKLAGVIREINSDNIVHAIGTHALDFLTSATPADPESEILLWAPETAGLAAAWTSAETRGQIRSDRDEGLIFRVFSSGRSEAEAGVDLLAADWTNLEKIRGIPIAEMAASPVVAFETCIAVLSHVRYGIAAEDTTLEPPAETAALLARLIEGRLIRAILGLEST